MSIPAKLAAYGAALALVVIGAFAVGTAVGPLSPATAPAGVGGHTDASSGTAAEAGLASSSGGYTLTPIDATLTPGIPETFAFRVTGPDGTALTAFEVEHDKRMHLIVVRRDAAGFQHVHSEMAADGTWSLPVTLPAAGSYRAFADFTPTGGTGTVLGIDLAAPGSFEPVAHAPSRTAHVDGYTVELAGDLLPGQASPVTLTVTRDGQPVTDLQPYLGTHGHLVALREGDLAYLHVHPDGGTASGPQIQFVAEVPSAGTYRLFLNFQHAGAEHTAEFTVTTGPDAAAVPARHTDAPGAPAHGH